ncbi:hypothetical protein SAMN05414139_01393 [Burkholderia sp. D7]|nr:hypothetical protein SAMN05414139_01393 [Burkholderia sp. D7]
MQTLVFQFIHILLQRNMRPWQKCQICERHNIEIYSPTLGYAIMN